MSVMVAPLFDTLKYVERLKDAGVPETQAKAEAEVLRDALSESLVTVLAGKEDIRIAKEELQGEIRAVKDQLQNEVRAVKKELHSEIRAVKEELQSEIRAVKEELQSEIRAVKEDVRTLQEETRAIRADMKAMEMKLTIRTGGMMTVMTGILYTLLRLH